MAELNFWEEHYIFLYKSWGFELVNHNLFPSNTGVAYNPRPKHSVVMKAKFRDDKDFADRQRSNLSKIRANPEVEKRRINNSMKVIMTKECLYRRAETNRRNQQKEFEVHKNGEYVGVWLNHSTCSRALGMTTASVTRCLTGSRKQCYGYTFKYVNNVNTCA